MDIEQNGSRIAQQGMGMIAEQIADQERKQKAIEENIKGYGKQQAFGKVSEKVKPFKNEMMNKAFANMPKGMQKAVIGTFKAHSKFMDTLSKSFGKSKLGQAMGRPFAVNAAKAQMVADRLQNSVRDVATKATTKAAAATLAAPTGGLSLVAEKAATAAKGAVDVAKTTKDIKLVTNVAKGAADNGKDLVADKASQLVESKVTDAVSKVAPGVGKLQGMMGKAATKKEEKDKDYNMAIFSGTKNIVSKAGITKGLDIMK